MKYILACVAVFCVGYIALHRPTKPRGPTKASDTTVSTHGSKYRGRSLEDLRAELGAKEELLAEMERMVTNKAVSTPNCPNPQNITFSEETYRTMRELKSEVAALRQAIGSRK
jgi:hypothetical protein